MIKYKYLTLNQINKHEPLMKQLRVSEVARSPRGFLPAYKRAGGNPSRLSESWRKKRYAFIRRHIVQYRKKPTLRRKLALIAWAYMP